MSEFHGNSQKHIYSTCLSWFLPRSIFVLIWLQRDTESEAGSTRGSAAVSECESVRWSVGGDAHHALPWWSLRRSEKKLREGPTHCEYIKYTTSRGGEINKTLWLLHNVSTWCYQRSPIWPEIFTGEAFVFLLNTQDLMYSNVWEGPKVKIRVIKMPPKQFATSPGNELNFFQRWSGCFTVKSSSWIFQPCVCMKNQR